MRLGSATWPDVDPRHMILVVPIGSCEQHGPHLPLDTDTRIAVALGESLAIRRDDIAVAPPITYGSSGEHAGFPGTLSIGQDALEVVLVELVRSADEFRGVILVNGHGGNAEPVARAAATMADEGRRALPWAPRLADGDAHAGRTETSLLLALDPTVVRLDRAVSGVTVPISELLTTLRTSGVRSVAPNGVLGDPTGASAAEGSRLLETLGQDLAGAVARWIDAWA